MRALWSPWKPASESGRSSSQEFTSTLELSEMGVFWEPPTGNEGSLPRTPWHCSCAWLFSLSLLQSSSHVSLSAAEATIPVSAICLHLSTAVYQSTLYSGIQGNLQGAGSYLAHDSRRWEAEEPGAGKGLQAGSPMSGGREGTAGKGGHSAVKFGVSVTSVLYPMAGSALIRTPLTMEAWSTMKPKCCPVQSPALVSLVV